VGEATCNDNWLFLSEFYKHFFDGVLGPCFWEGLCLQSRCRTIIYLHELTCNMQPHPESLAIPWKLIKRLGLPLDLCLLFWVELIILTERNITTVLNVFFRKGFCQLILNGVNWILFHNVHNMIRYCNALTTCTLSNF